MNDQDTQPSPGSECGAASVIIEMDETCATLTLPGGHELAVDLPDYAGGGNAGPAPIDLLVGALAASQAMMIRAQAQRKGWPMARTTISATHERISARDAGLKSRGTVDSITCELKLEGDELTHDQRFKLMKLADHCWVHHALVHPTQVQALLAEA